MQPRLIRLRDAPNYLGMDRNRFNSEVRPYLVTLKIGQQGIAFDRLDLDQWADQFKQNQGKPAQETNRWQKNKNRPVKAYRQDKNKSKHVDDEFENVLQQILSTKNELG